MALETQRLTLIPCAPEQLLALIDEPERFESLLGLPAADGLRAGYVSDDVSPDWLAALRSSRDADPWRHGFFVVDRESGWVIGSAGFKGPPDETGTVEIAYGIVPSREGHGYATEATAALVRFACADEHVRVVRAHTLPMSSASTRVLQKCGFRHTGTVVDPDDGPVWRWERDPEPFLTGTEMRSQTTTALYPVVIVAVIVAIDVLFFKNQFWERLTVNIGIVLAFAAFYFRFLKRPSARRRRGRASTSLAPPGQVPAA